MPTFETLYLDTVDSTSSFLKNHPDLLQKPFFTVTAREQTGGRGRYSRRWYMRKDDLAFSFVYRAPSAATAGITLVTGVSLLEFLQSEAGAALELKWPNDILFRGKKLCGILTEALPDHNIFTAVIGVGINVNSTVFPEEIAGLATSLKLIGGKDFSATEMLPRLCEKLYAELAGAVFPLPPLFCEKFMEHSGLRNRRVLVELENRQREARIKGISPTGSLLLELLPGKNPLEYFGEICYPAGESK